MKKKSLIDLGGVMVDPEEQLREFDRADCEESLYEFLRRAWRYLDSSTWKDGWPIEAVAEHLQAVADGDIKRLIVNIPPRMGKSSITSVAFPAWVWLQPFQSATSGPGTQFLHASYASSLSLRDSVKCRRLIETPWYQELWGSRFQLNSDQNTKSRFSNDKGGERLITSIGAAVTGEGGNIIVIDDPNAANEAFSEATIQSTIDWWDGTMSTRLNDMKTGAYIIIQQRLAEDDLTGHVLEKNVGEWTHLCLPMRYEKSRAFVTSIGWEDPRSEEGELLWPDRFGPAEVVLLERTLGPYGCNPYEAPVLMADLSMRNIGEVRAGDEIVGFSKKERVDGKNGRNRLQRATVLAVQKRKAKVVKMTLDSGEVIRCTRDHKWYVGKDRGNDRGQYLPVTLGRSSLSRICPPRLPDLTPEEQRLAGWVAGFFDGEGSVSLCAKSEDHYKKSSSITFYQGSGRNLPLCEKLESALEHFGFDYTCREDERKENKTAACYGYRQYRLKGTGLPLMQKFLHLIRPVKWRDRIIDGAYGSKFIVGREKVVSIEEDGEEDVYALTTTTGNYVVWGLASSNSAGQLQQRPEPAGGGVIKREWWNLWEEAVFPPMDYIVASLDTAYTTKTINDQSALTIWGVFTGDSRAQMSRIVGTNGHAMAVDRTYVEGAPKVMLMHAWADRLELHELVEKVAKTCKQLKVDRLLIENKASGISVSQEMRRLYSNENYAVQLCDPKSQDKLSRLYSVQHLFAEGLVYAPDRSWADMVITQVGQFPKGRRDDLVDTVSQAIKHLRDQGLLIMAEEHQADIEAQKVYPGGQPPPLYPA